MYGDCPICFENMDLTITLPCKHRYCSNCLENTFAAHVDRLGIHIPFFCPGCKVTIDTKVAKTYMTDEYRDKYERWVRGEKRGARSRFCCRGPEEEIVILEEEDVDKNIFLNDSYVKGLARRCAHCKAPTQKNGGCDHMTCSRCGKEWCWVCQDRYHPSFTCAAYKRDKWMRPYKKAMGIMMICILLWIALNLGMWFVQTSVFTFIWQGLKYPFVGIWVILKAIFYAALWVGNGIVNAVSGVLPESVTGMVSYVTSSSWLLGITAWSYFYDYIYYPFDAVMSFISWVVLSVISFLFMGIFTIVCYIGWALWKVVYTVLSFPFYLLSGGETAAI